MQMQMLLIIISALGVSLFAGVDYCLLRRNVDIRLRRKVLLVAMLSSVLLPILGGLAPLTLPLVVPELVDHIGFTLELPTLWVGSKGSDEFVSTETTGAYSLTAALGILWFAGFVYMVLRTLRGLISLWYLIRRAQREYNYEGIDVYRLPPDCAIGAFSFSGRIYIPCQTMKENEKLNYILRHEAAHVHDGHNNERLWALLFRALHWYLPTARYLYRALDDTHEYIADRLTLDCQDSDAKIYQYQLLSSALLQCHHDIAHAFNTNKQQLKKRIAMMNKVNISTRPLGWVWFLCLPIACLMLWASNSVVAAEREQAPQKKDEPREKVQEVISEDQIYDQVEEAPEFPGGMEALMKYLSSNLRYPSKLSTSTVQGRVIIQFVVNTDGRVADARVVRSVHKDLDAEALRVVRAMPRWKPGKRDGKFVRTRFHLPIAFRLQ